jgi:hypothetical protein
VQAAGVQLETGPPQHTLSLLPGGRDVPTQRDRRVPANRTGLESNAETKETVLGGVESQITAAITRREEIVGSWTSLLALKKQLHTIQGELIDEMMKDADARDLIFIREYRSQTMRNRARDLDASDAIDREWKTPRLILEPVGMDAPPTPPGGPAHAF